ncbi:MAG: MetS family NSS transporter small subunit [bacterium]
MPASAWITLVLASLILYGGAALCLLITLRKPGGYVVDPGEKEHPEHKFIR